MNCLELTWSACCPIEFVDNSPANSAGGEYIGTPAGEITNPVVLTSPVALTYRINLAGLVSFHGAKSQVNRVY